jgi:hypothetical protein
MKRKQTFDTWEKKLTVADEPITKKRRRTLDTPFASGRREVPPRHGGLALGSLTNVMGGHLPEPVKTVRKKVVGVGEKEDLPVQPVAAGSKEEHVRASTHGNTLAKLLQNALIWFARTIDANGVNPPWPPQWKQHIPRGNYLHSFEALLVGCGWGDDGGCEWAERGVIFVDESEVEGKQWKEYVLRTLEERERSVEKGGRGKQIWVFDVQVLWIESEIGHVYGYK